MTMLETLAEGGYFANGIYFTDTTVTMGLPFAWRFTVRHSFRKLELEGVYFQHSGRPQHPFKMTLMRREIGRMEFQLESPHVGEIRGACAGHSAGADLSGHCTGRSGSASMHLSEIKPRVFEGSGILDLGPDFSVAFTVTISSDDPTVTLSNVVDMNKGTA